MKVLQMYAQTRPISFFPWRSKLKLLIVLSSKCKHYSVKCWIAQNFLATYASFCHVATNSEVRIFRMCNASLLAGSQGVARTQAAEICYFEQHEAFIKYTRTNTLL